MDFASASIELDPRKVGVMFSILLVSLFAVSFPTLSKLLPFLRIPTVVFFVGKHFGTGVILATAFIHLLDDAFRSLQSAKVEHNYPGLGKWTGFIILASLLSIFLVEYISTTYVEQLQDKPSAPPTPVPSTPPTRSQSPSAKVTALLVTENTPLLPTASAHPQRRHTVDAHHHHHNHLHPTELSGVPVAVLHNSPRICRLAIAHDHVNGHHCHPHEHPLHEEYGLDSDFQEHAKDDESSHHHHHPRIGRRRQIIGILVLQMGIMIHSLVIGMTLAIASGSEFTSLTTAIIFHQLFEGLSLGIRIAALPDAHREEGTEATVAALQESTDDVEAGRSEGERKPFSLCRRMPDVHWFKPTLSFLFGITTPFGMALGMVLWPVKTPTGGAAKMLVVQGVMSAISAGMLIYAATVEMLAADFVFGDVEGGTHHHHHHGGHDHDHEHEHELEHEHENGHHNTSHNRIQPQHNDRARSPPRTRKRSGTVTSAPHAMAPAAAGAPSCPRSSPIPAYWMDSAPGKAIKFKVTPRLARGSTDDDDDAREDEDDDVREEERSSAHNGLGHGHGHGHGHDDGDGTQKASVAKRAVAVLSLLAGVGMMVLVGLGE
ncbi:Zinc/iron permease [Pholiota conissans]|uniref:Zinc/iron permease n=1 Tax=Pholiota conissans TaxID=109636 RepID=A0A9P5Z8J8_9AGAR|nr:Zinc/iron permease [Pholiota conissans]